MTTFTWRPGAPSFIEADGQRLEAICHGPSPREAPTIVLLHEGLGCIALWRDFPQKLAAATGFGVFAYSRAGYGRSDPIALPRPLDYMQREAIETLPRVLDAIGAERLLLVGHSDGASIAAIHAGQLDEPRLLRIALMAPHFFAEPESLTAVRAAEQAFAEGDLRPRLAKYHDDVEGAFFGWSRAWLDPAFARWNIAEAIEGWRVPALVAQGLDDPYGTIKQVMEVQRRCRQELSTLTLPRCGHAPQFDAPERTLAALAEFCVRCARAP